MSLHFNEEYSMCYEDAFSDLTPAGEKMLHVFVTVPNNS